MKTVIKEPEKLDLYWVQLSDFSCTDPDPAENLIGIYHFVEKKNQSIFFYEIDSNSKTSKNK